MIAQLTGVLVESNFTSCVVDVNGVGYDVAIPMSTFDNLPKVGERVKLLIHTQVREDAISLFGFLKADERDLFQILINVSGIGGKMGLNILSAMPATNFCVAVVNQDIKTLTRINGIGKRTAERIIVELKERLADFGGVSASSAVGGGSSEASAINDAALALEKLGFRQASINNVLNKLIKELPEDERTTENLTRKAVQLLNF